MKNKFLISIIVSLVFIFSGVSTSYAYYTNMPADVVLGQTNFTSNSTGTTQSKFKNVIRGVFVDPNGRLIVSEYNNHRVLIWNEIPTENGKPADLVLGQDDFVSGSSNRGIGINSNTLSNPSSTWSDGNKLIINDRGNDRVLIWNSFPTQNGQSADIVVGNTVLNSDKADTCDASTFTDNYGMTVYDGKLLVVDRTYDRVLIWNSIPSTNGASADIVIGQSDLNTCNGSLPVSDSSLDDARGIIVDKNGKLFVVDRGRQRILIWNSVPTENNVPADVVVGQPDFTSSGAGVSASRFGSLLGVFSNGTRLFASDGDRVLIFNTIPSYNEASADVVIGQADFDTNTANKGGSTSQSSLYETHYSYEYDNKLIVVDEGNARILIFTNTLSTPSLWINQLEGISGKREKVSGTVYLGEQGKYAIQRIQAQINGIGYDDVLNKDGGRYDGDSHTLYDWYHEFNPWSNYKAADQWTDGDGYTLKIKSTSFNGEDDYAFRFTPFSLESVDVSGTQPIFNFFVPIDHINTIRNNVKHFEVLIDDKKYLTNILGDVINSETGKASVSITTDGVTSVSLNLPAGTHSAKIRSVDQWGYYFDSNSVDFESTSGIYSTNGTLSTSSWFPLQINSISGANSAILSSFKPGEILPSYTTVNLNPTIEGIAFANTKITLTVTNADDTTQSTTIQTKTNPDSTFTLSPTLFPNSLISISASDSKGNSTSLPIFKLTQ